MMDFQAMATEIQSEIIEIWKNEYNWGWFGDKDKADKTFQGYVQQGILSQEGYRQITGDNYEASQTVSNQSQD